MAAPDAVTRRVAGAARFPVPLGRRFSKTLFLKKLLRANPWRAIPSQLAGFTRDAVEALWPLPLHPALVIAVSGMDGAGKSTAIAELRQLCTDLELKHEVVWLRAGNSDLMQGLNRIMRTLVGRWLRRSTNDERLEALPGGVRPERIIARPWLANLWYGVALGELWIRALLQIRWGRLRRRVVICDRYLADSLVDLAIRCGRTESIDHLASKAPARWFPRPDLSIVLLADARTAHGRKEQEFTLEQMELRARLYGEATRAASAQAIDTTAGKPATFARLRDIVLALYAPPMSSGR
jgi:thymidylate kinase